MDVGKREDRLLDHISQQSHRISECRAWLVMLQQTEPGFAAQCAWLIDILDGTAMVPEEVKA